MNRPIPDVAFDIAVYAADVKDQAEQIKRRQPGGASSSTPPDFEDEE